MIEAFVGVNVGLPDREITTLVLLQKILDGPNTVRDTQFGILLVGQFGVPVAGSGVV